MTKLPTSGSEFPTYWQGFSCLPQLLFAFFLSLSEKLVLAFKNRQSFGFFTVFNTSEVLPVIMNFNVKDAVENVKKRLQRRILIEKFVQAVNPFHVVHDCTCPFQFDGLLLEWTIYNVLLPLNL